MKRISLLFLVGAFAVVSCIGCGNTKNADEPVDNVLTNSVYEESIEEESNVQSDEVVVEDNTTAEDNEKINFFIDESISNKDKLLDLFFTEMDENGNPTMLYVKGGNHSEITLCNYQIVSGSVENCSKENSIIIYADCLYSDNESDQLSINLYPTDDGNIWEMMVTSPADLEGYYLLEGPEVNVSQDTNSAKTSGYWFVDYQFVRDDENATIKLTGVNGDKPSKIEVTNGEPFNINETYDIEDFYVEQKSTMYEVRVTYYFYNSEGELTMSELDFECQDGEAEVSAPGNLYGHYRGF